MALVTIQGLIGNVWVWVSPWPGPVWLVRRIAGLRRFPARTGLWPGLLCFLLFSGFLLADPAPTDPDRLAAAVLLYWLAQFTISVLVGPHWLQRGEGLTLAMNALAYIGILGRRRGRLALGLPGWQIAHARASTLTALALISVLLLGVGSFDGMHETFWWLDRLAVNPFDYPGRSGLVWQTLRGLFGFQTLLLAIVAFVIWLGLRLANQRTPLFVAVSYFAPTLLPIALGYHVAHYLPSFLVEAQYGLVAVSDPLMRGADILGLGQFYVTTGFFNTPDTVRTIFLTQTTAIVFGHVLAVLLAHALAIRANPTAREAVLTQAPLAVFMIGYTLFGLWLLASPRL